MADTVPYQAYRSKRHSSPYSRPSSYIAPENDPPGPAIISPELVAAHTIESHPAPLTSPVPSSSGIPPVKKASTFRRVPLRNPHPPLLSSPLVPSHATPPHSRNVSTSSQRLLVSQSPPNVSSPLSRRASTPARTQDTIHFQTPSHVQVPTTPDLDLVSPPTIPLTNTIPGRFRESTASPTYNSSSPHPKSTIQHVTAPYRPGFQPKGLYRHLTDEFLALRLLKQDGEGGNGRVTGMKRVERTKLTRRLEKLIDLHFPPLPADGVPLSSSSRRNTSTDVRIIDPGAGRASTFLDFDIRNVNISDPGIIWRGVVGGGDVRDIRASEQRITPWQSDGEVTKCPLCFASFHPLTNRKHHCRLCGKVICSLPVKRPYRPALCSLLFAIDRTTGRIEEVGEAVDYGVRRRKVGHGGATKSGNGTVVEEDKFLKGVRICRTCRPILLRQQYQQEITHLPTFSKIYEAFIGLEQEIEESLPQFQELVLSLSHNNQPTKEASATRKRLLDAFAQYDRLAKRIRSLPCPNGSGSSQDRVQVAIMTRATLFLQKNMFTLRSLPTSNISVVQSPKFSGTLGDRGRHLGPDSEVALTLQPLLEQEALLESFVGEAKANRKFEDVKTLKANLQEIREEIEKILTNAEGGMYEYGNSLAQSE